MNDKKAKIEEFENILKYKNEDILSLKMKIVEMVADLDCLHYSDDEENDVEINLVSQFSDTEPVEAETLVNWVQCNNVFNTRHGLRYQNH